MRAVNTVSWLVPYKMKVTRVEQHTYIKIAVLLARNVMECHSELVETVGNNTLLYRIVAWWIRKFQQGRVSTSDEQGSGRPVSLQTDLACAIIKQFIDYIKNL
ncbi:HTH_48 domain-containing protein [Trichonephila clavipes]|nr:HTH_48 domain-containing protein [Trichonephila clavipes]